MKPLSYPVPWDLVLGLWPQVARMSRTSLDDFTRRVVSRMNPPPIVEGLDRLPENPRFVLVANHYQRQGLWILHSASAVTQAIRAHYGEGDPPVRWLATANWPPLEIGPWKLPSPGDWLLPRVAHALHCYPVSFAGSNPRATAQSLRRVLSDAKTAVRPIGIFPEGVAGSAGRLTHPLPGVERLIRLLAQAGLPVAPCGVSERDDALIIRFGIPIAASEMADSADPARSAMSAVAALTA